MSAALQLAACGSCRHFTLTMPTTRFGICATGAWVSSYVPGTGYYLTPHESIRRECARWEAAL